MALQDLKLVQKLVTQNLHRKSSTRLYHIFVVKLYRVTSPYSALAFKNMRTLKYKKIKIIQAIIMLFTSVHLLSGPIRKQNRLAQRRKKIMFVRCLGGFRSTVVGVIMIDGSKTHKSLLKGAATTARVQYSPATCVLFSKLLFNNYSPKAK